MTIRKNLVEWLTQRGTALVIVPTLFLGNTFTVLLVLNFIVFEHLYFGLKEILTDYIHDEVTRNLLITLIQILMLIVIKNTFLLLNF